MSIKREANKTPDVEKYIRLKKIYGHVEVKHARGERFYLSNFEPHQLESLEAAHDKGLVMKWSDADPRLKTCDIISTPPGLPSYVAIIFSNRCLFISSWLILDLVKNGRKSLTVEQARVLSVFEIIL